VSVKYLVEEERKGTAGSLSLLPADIKDDIVVMNGDLLTKIDFEKMLRFHKASQVSATMAVKDYEMNVPYGVVDIDVQSLITGFREKPAYRFFVNAGVYILSPECLKKIPRDKAFDMPMLFDVLRNEGLRTGAFPLREYWMDIGVPQDFERANSDYGTEFVSG